MSDFFREIFNGIKDLIERNPIAGYLTLALFIAVILVTLNYLFKALKSNYLRWLAPLGQTLPFPVLVLLQEQLKTAFGTEITIAILLAAIFYVALTNIIYSNLIQIEAGKSKNGQLLIIALGTIGLILWIMIISASFYDFSISGTGTAPPPAEPVR